MAQAPFSAARISPFWWGWSGLTSGSHTLGLDCVGVRLFRYETRKKNIAALKEENSQLFIRQIQRILKKNSADIEKANKREIRNIYLLFKSLQEICSSLMSYKDLAHMGCFFTDFSFDKLNHEIAQLQQQIKQNKDMTQDQIFDIKRNIKVLQEQASQQYDQSMQNICDFEQNIKWESTVRLIKTVSTKSSFELAQHLMIVMRFSSPVPPSNASQERTSHSASA